MIDVPVNIVGAEAVTLRLQSAPERVRAAVRNEVQRLGLELQRLVKESQLTGQALHVRTGRLRRSVNLQATANGSEITASVGTNLVYGRFWELGFDGVEQVREHTRRSSGGKGSAAAALVRAHERRVHAAPRPFLQPALEQIRPSVAERIRAAVEGAV